MKAMILAAGRGERLRPLTDTTPKPLIKVAGKSLIEYHLENLASAGFNEIIVNTAWLADEFHTQLGDGAHFGINIQYSDEGKALETAGGILKALPLLGEQPFLVVNGDIWCDFDFSVLPEISAGMQAHLVLVKNPEHNSTGDFSLQGDLIKNTGEPMFTFSGIGIYQPCFFAEQTSGIIPLAPLIRSKSNSNLVSGQLHKGNWTDVGTLARLQQLEQHLKLQP